MSRFWLIFFLVISNFAYSDDITILQTAINNYKSGKISNIPNLERNVQDFDIRKVIRWIYLKSNDSNAKFNDYAGFINNNKAWPEINKIIINAEKRLDFSLGTDVIKKWCGAHKPITGNAHKVCNINDAVLAKDVTSRCSHLRNAWVYGSYVQGQEDEFMLKYGKCIRPIDNTKRMERLLWNDNVSAARRMIKYLNSHGKKVFNLISEIRNGKVPVLDHETSSNDLILFELVNLYKKKNKIDRMDDIIIQAKDVEYPEKWWNIRNLRTREAINNKNYSLAYRLVKHHDLNQGKEFVDAEWLCGWINYSFLKNYKLAQNHFHRLYKNSKYTMSKVRAAYWLGLTYQKLNNLEESKKWIGIASKHPEIFYGQMAIIKSGHNSFKLPQVPHIDQQDKAKANKNDIYRVASKLLKAKMETLSKTFIFEGLYRAHSPKEAYLFAKLPIDILQNRSLSVEASKEAARYGFVFTDIGYPNIKNVKNFLIEKEWAESITRQESNFNTNAKSTAGALGYMQLLPSAARDNAKKMGLVFNQRKLTSDPNYNVSIGQYYLYQLENLYDGNYVLATMAYNAGIGNVRKWLNNIGSPSDLKSADAVINWIESTPFSETRNYVLRILENLQMYRALRDQKHESHRIYIVNDLLSADHLKKVSLRK